MVSLRFLVAIAVLSGACKSDLEKRKERWTDYTQKVVADNAVVPAFEKLDAALASGDRAALARMFMPTVYDVGLSSAELVTHTSDEVIESQLAALAACGLAGKTDRLFEGAGVVAAVGLKNATFEEVGEKAAESRERVLPDDGVWLIAQLRPDAKAALATCGNDRSPFAVVLAPTTSDGWRVVGWTFLR